MDNIKKSVKFRSKDFLVLFTILVVINWKAITLFYIQFDAAGRIPVFLLLLSLYLNWRDIKQYILKGPIAIYCGIAIYMCANAIFKGSQVTFEKDPYWNLFRGICETPLLMLVTANLFRKDLDKTLKWVVICFTIYCIAMIVNFSASSSAITTSSGDVRIGSSSINPNDIALNAAFAFGFYLLLFFRKAISSQMTLLCAIPFITVLMTGSRMGLAMIIIISAGAAPLKINFKKPQTIIATIIASIGIYFFFEYILYNTYVGDRILGTKDQGLGYEFHTGTILDYYGDRGFQYYFSWPYFLENPFTGLGYSRWPLFNPQYGMACHSEYMVQYVENGLLAFIPYLFFWKKLYQGLRLLLTGFTRIDRETAILLLAMFLSLVYSNSVLYSFNMSCVFVFYALAYCYPRKAKRVF